LAAPGPAYPALTVIADPLRRA